MKKKKMWKRLTKPKSKSKKQSKKKSSTDYSSFESVTLQEETDIAFGHIEGKPTHSAQLVYQFGIDSIFEELNDDQILEMNTRKRSQSKIDAVKEFVILNIPDVRYLMYRPDTRTHCLLLMNELDDKIWDRIKNKKYYLQRNILKKKEQEYIEFDSSDSNTDKVIDNEEKLIVKQFLKFRKWKLSPINSKKISGISEDEIKQFNEFFDFKQWQSVQEYNRQNSNDPDSKPSPKQDTKKSTSSSKKSNHRSSTLNRKSSSSKKISHEQSSSRKSTSRKSPSSGNNDEDNLGNVNDDIESNVDENSTNSKQLQQQSTNFKKIQKTSSSRKKRRSCPTRDSVDEEESGSNDESLDENFNDSNSRPKRKKTKPDFFGYEEDQNKVINLLDVDDDTDDDSDDGIASNNDEDHDNDIEGNTKSKDGDNGDNDDDDDDDDNDDDDKNKKDDKDDKNDKDDKDDKDDNEDDNNSSEVINFNFSFENEDDANLDSGGLGVAKATNDEPIVQSLKSSRVQRKSFVDMVNENRKQDMIINDQNYEQIYKESHLYFRPYHISGAEIGDRPEPEKLNVDDKDKMWIQIDTRWKLQKFKTMTATKEANVPGDGNCALAAFLACYNDENGVNYCLHDNTIGKMRKFFSYSFMKTICNPAIYEWESVSNLRYRTLCTVQDEPYKLWYEEHLENSYTDTGDGNILSEDMWFDTEVHFVFMSFFLRKSILVYQYQKKGRKVTGKYCYIKYDKRYPHMLPLVEFNDIIGDSSPKRKTFYVDKLETYFFVHEIGQHYDALVFNLKTVKNISAIPDEKNNHLYTKVDKKSFFHVDSNEYEKIKNEYIETCEVMLNKPGKMPFMRSRFGDKPRQK